MTSFSAVGSVSGEKQKSENKNLQESPLAELDESTVFLPCPTLIIICEDLCRSLYEFLQVSKELTAVFKMVGMRLLATEVTGLEIKA